MFLCKLIQTHQLLNFLTSSFNPPKNPWDVQKIASYTPLMTACPRHWLRLKPCRLRWLKRKCWRRRRCQSIEMEAVGRVGSWFRNAGGLGNVLLVPNAALNYGVFCFETWVGFVFSLEGCWWKKIQRFYGIVSLLAWQFSMYRLPYC